MKNVVVNLAPHNSVTDSRTELHPRIAKEFDGIWRHFPGVENCYFER